MLHRLSHFRCWMDFDISWCVHLQLKKLARTKRPFAATVKCRLAGRLGIGLPPAGRQIPTMVKSPSLSGFVESRAMSSDIGTSGLSIMGNRDDLDPFRLAAYSLYVNFMCSKSSAFWFSCKQAIEVCILLSCIARTMYVDVVYCYRPSSERGLLVCHTSEPRKNSWTDRDAVWVEDSGWP